MLDKIDKLRKAPQPVKEHLVSVITISVMAVVTVIWFLFSLSSFFKPAPAVPASGAATSTPPPTPAGQASTSIQAPFSQ